MKEKSNATLRRAASLRCRTDAAIARLGRAVACCQRGAITTAELLEEASAAADRAGTLELSTAELAATGSFGRSVNRKVEAYRGYARTAARIAMEAGCDMVITNGARPEDLYGIVAGEDIGTRFVAQPEILEL